MGRGMSVLGSAPPNEATPVPLTPSPPTAGSVQADDAPLTTSVTSAETSHTDASSVGSRRLYLLVGAKFSLVVAFMAAWVWLSVWISGG